jgi:iron complex transport system substrate-binding protein
VEGILDYIRRLGALVGAADNARTYADKLEADLAAVADQAARNAHRPKVYFEEWDEPLISGIQWVAELVRIAGGDDILPELAAEPMAKNRIMADGSTVIERNPDIIFGSWCGKKFRPEKVAARPGWQDIAAVRNHQLFEIKSPIILQPGPAALSDGLKAIAAHIRSWQRD